VEWSEREDEDERERRKDCQILGRLEQRNER
jgi:hypothetical protein